jgi:hypothetical protein
MATPEWEALLVRLRSHAEHHQRDHWVQCSACSKWRSISYQKQQQAQGRDWTCTELQ